MNIEEAAQVTDPLAGYAWLETYMPLIFTIAATVLFVRYTKVLIVQWLSLHIANRLTKGRVTVMTRSYRKWATAFYSVMIGALAAGYFIERGYSLLGMAGPQWRVMLALAIPLLVFGFIEAFRQKENLLGKIARWLSAGEVNLTREEELAESLETASEQTVFRALNAAGLDGEKYAKRKREKE